MPEKPKMIPVYNAKVRLDGGWHSVGPFLTWELANKMLKQMRRQLKPRLVNAGCVCAEQIPAAEWVEKFPPKPGVLYTVRHIQIRKVG